jgi:hypothetical protein
MSTIETIATIVNRAAVALVGVLLGLLTFFPNVMMSDSGTTAAQLAAGLGVLASFLMALGGIVGAVRGSPAAGWFWLLPGVGCQFLVFVPALIDGIWQTCCRQPQDSDVNLWQMCHRRGQLRQQQAAAAALSSGPETASSYQSIVQ